MNTDEPLKDWEKTLHRELDALPELEAPSTLIPAVMSRLHSPAPAVWYRSPWWQWPLALRVASVLMVFAVLGGLGWVSGTTGELGLGRQVTQAFAELKSTLASVLNTTDTVLGSYAGFLRENGQLILLSAASLLFATYLTCVAAGTALYQLAWRRFS